MAITSRIASRIRPIMSCVLLLIVIRAFLNLLLYIPVSLIGEEQYTGKELITHVLSKIYWIFYGGLTETVTWDSLWFLPCLFLSSLFFFFLMKLRNHYVQIFIIMGFVILQQILTNRITMVLPWHPEAAVLGTAFMMIGYKIRENNLLLPKKNSLIILIFIFILGSAIILNNGIFDMNLNQLGTHFLFGMLGAVCISYFVMWSFIRLKPNRFLSFLGQHTLIVIGFNDFIFSCLDFLWVQIPLLGQYTFPWVIKSGMCLMICMGIMFFWLKANRRFSESNRFFQKNS